MAALSVHDKKATDDQFISFFPKYPSFWSLDGTEPRKMILEIGFKITFGKSEISINDEMSSILPGSQRS